MKTILTISGKGGTGKSIVSINIAKALKAKKKKVALIDLDLDSSNTSNFLKIDGDFSVGWQGDKRWFIPVEYDGMQMFSMSFVTKNTPVSMKGSGYAQIVRDVITGTRWDAEYFVCDLPSGLGQIFREVVSVLAESLLGSVIVMQPAHMIDAERVLELHKREDIPVLGLIENMSQFICPKCETSYSIFGDAVGEKISKDYGVDFFGSIPLSEQIRKGVEKGDPIIPKSLMKPIDNAVAKILQAKPLEPSLVERIREGVKKIGKDALLDLLAFSVTALNQIDLMSVMTPYGFGGGRTFELNITDKSLEKVVSKNCFRVENGVLKHVVNPSVIDAKLYIWDQALVWCSLGYMPGDDGERIPYSWKQAWQLNKVEFYGVQTQDALEFIDSLWKEIPPRLAQTNLLPFFERLA